MVDSGEHFEVVEVRGRLVSSGALQRFKSQSLVILVIEGGCSLIKDRERALGLLIVVVRSLLSHERRRVSVQVMPLNDFTRHRGRFQ